MSNEEIARDARTALNLATAELRRRPREQCRRLVERRLLVRLAAIVENRSAEEVERDVQSDEDAAYANLIADLERVHPLAAIAVDDRADTGPLSTA